MFWEFKLLSSALICWKDQRFLVKWVITTYYSSFTYMLSPASGSSSSNRPISSTRTIISSLWLKKVAVIIQKGSHSAPEASGPCPGNRHMISTTEPITTGRDMKRVMNKYSSIPSAFTIQYWLSVEMRWVQRSYLRWYSWLLLTLLALSTRLISSVSSLSWSVKLVEKLKYSKISLILQTQLWLI